MDKFIGLQRIKENSEKDIKIICDLLIEILKSIIDNPNDSNKRSIKLDSLETLMLLSGGMETLFEIGFVEDDESLTLPNDVKIEFLREFVNGLNKIAVEKSKSNPAEIQTPACRTTIEPAPSIPSVR